MKSLLKGKLNFLTKGFLYVSHTVAKFRVSGTNDVEFPFPKLIPEAKAGF